MKTSLIAVLAGMTALGAEYGRCFRELALARTLLACGDFEGLGRKTYEEYIQDPRGILSAHAKAVALWYNSRSKGERDGDQGKEKRVPEGGGRGGELPAELQHSGR